MSYSDSYPAEGNPAGRQYDEGQYDQRQYDQRQYHQGQYDGRQAGSNAAGAQQVAGQLPDERGVQNREWGSEGLDESLVTDAAGFQQRWDSIKVAFVDDPRRAVAEAEALLSEVVEDMLEGFRRDRQELEASWGRGDEGSTEHLRRSLRRYRSFYERLLQPQSGV